MNSDRVAIATHGDCQQQRVREDHQKTSTRGRHKSGRGAAEPIQNSRLLITSGEKTDSHNCQRNFSKNTDSLIKIDTLAKPFYSCVIQICKLKHLD